MECGNTSPISAPLGCFEEQHYPIKYWADVWCKSPKTVREWFREEYGPGILCVE